MLCTQWFFILIIFIMIYLATRDSNEYFDNDHVHFLTKQELIQFFKDDPDHYFHSFNQVNLTAYGYKNINDYVNAAINDAADFTEEEKKYITKECKKADDFLMKFDKIPYFPSQKVAKINWKIAKTNNNIYEKGYPHTRMDIIFMPRDLLMDRHLAQTLCHEKIHVFSRLFPEDMKRWNDKNGYILYRKLTDFPLARNNPDVDGLVYLDKNKKPTLAQYTTTKPRNIEEAVYPYGDNYKTEHPNEVLAYKVDAYLG